MTTLRSILVASDLSDASDEVVRSAGRLAAAAGAELHVLHACDFPSIPHSGEALPAASFQGTLEASQRKLDEQVHRTVPVGVTVASSRIEIYVAHKAILDGARAAKADLLVLGPHSNRRRGEGLLGTTADRVIRTAEVPCLIVRGSLSLPLRRVVIPLDLSSPALGALDTALAWGSELGSMAGGAGGELMVLHVIPRAFDLPDFPFDHAIIGPELHREVEAARQRVGGTAELNVREEIRWGDTPVDEIVRVAAEDQVDLLVLGTHGHGVVKRALIGSVASGVARRAACPVLLVPPALWEAGAVAGGLPGRASDRAPRA